MKIDMKSSGIEYTFNIKQCTLVYKKITSFEYSIVMQYENNSPGVCSETNTYKFKDPIELLDLSFENIISNVILEEKVSDLESTSIFQNAYLKMVESSQTEHVFCSGPEWMTSTLV